MHSIVVAAAAQVAIRPLHGCGFQLYCGFDDWFIGTGGIFVLALLGGLIVRRWRDIPIVAIVALVLTDSFARLIHSDALHVQFTWKDGVGLLIELAALMIVAALAHALKRAVLRRRSRAVR